MRVDDRLDTGGECDHARKVDQLAISLMEMFGDRALEVSEGQGTLGNVDSVSSIWREISENIRKRNATG